MYSCRCNYRCRFRYRRRYPAPSSLALMIFMNTALVLLPVFQHLCRLRRATGACSAKHTACRKCQGLRPPTLAPANGWWELMPKCSAPSSLGSENSQVCVLYRPPEALKGIKRQLPTLETCWKIHLFLASFLSFFPFSLTDRSFNVGLHQILGMKGEDVKLLVLIPNSLFQQQQIGFLTWKLWLTSNGSLK